MGAWQQWRDRAKAAKQRSGKSDADLAEIISDLSPRKAGRAQVNHWFTGTREPTLSQFMLLCEELRVDPCEILFGHADPDYKPAPLTYKKPAATSRTSNLHDVARRHRKPSL